MPELPEVETICRTIEPKILGKSFSAIWQSDQNLRYPIPHDFAQVVTGRKVTKITRRAKYMLLHLEEDLLVIMHFGMSGKVTFANGEYVPQKHDHFIVNFDDGLVMVYNDARRFGLVSFLQAKGFANHKFFKHLGVEPLVGDFDAKYLYKISRKRTVPIKVFIMDQKIVVGVGNIYAAEALFLSGISPIRAAQSLTRKEAVIFVDNIKKVLIAAIKAGGSSIRDYVNSDNDIGYFQHEFRVYGRENKPCYQCDGGIDRMVQAGRSTFFCKQCQK
jgi:formamidopyrimidine-DNA glycosylase